MAPRPAEAYQCDQCGTTTEGPASDAPDAADDQAQCAQCGSTSLSRFDPRADPFPHQPNPELLHLQHLTPRPPLAPGAMAGMGPYMPLPRQRSGPARWAEDPSGRNQWRWWSGRVWTDHVANDGVVTTDVLD